MLEEPAKALRSFLILTRETSSLPQAVLRSLRNPPWSSTSASVSSSTALWTALRILHPARVKNPKFLLIFRFNFVLERMGKYHLAVHFNARARSQLADKEDRVRGSDLTSLGIGRVGPDSCDCDVVSARFDL